MQILDVQNLPLDKKVLIEASAGTGKTYTIGLIVLRLLLEKNIPIDKIALITFTKAATAELKKNTWEKIREAYDTWENGPNEKKVNLLDAIARIDEMPVFTIHGFCERLLSEFAFEIGNFEEKEIATDSNHIKDRIVADFWRREIQNLDEIIALNPKELSNAVDVILNHSQAKIAGEDYEQALIEYKNITDDGKKKDAERKLKYAIVYKLAKEVYEKISEEKRKLKIMDFNDMIENCYRAIKNDSKNILQKAVEKRYSAILVDEFQDTDKMQFEIFDYLFKNKPFFMIGDPKQAIYKFRGGDIFAYNEAKISTGKNQFSMNTNYRSEKTLLDALNSFFSSDFFKGKMGNEINYDKVKCGKPELKPIKEKDAQYKPFVIWRGANNENKEIFEPKAQAAVITEIKRLLNSGNFEPKDIAILLDNNNDCLNYKNALAKENIFAIVKGASVFASEAASFLRVLLNAICYYNNVKYVRALLTNNFCGFELSNIDAAFTEWANVIYEAKIKWEKHGIMNAIDFFMTRQNLWKRIAANTNGERNITNIRQLMELLNEEEVKFGKIPEKINNRLAALCSETEKKEEAEERLETDEDALKIMTIHRAKGLQFDIVFVPDISRTSRVHKFPSPYIFHANGRETIAYFAKNEPAKELSSKGENEEIARLLYVALTRAKYRLYVVFSPRKRKSDSICREIFEKFSAQNENIDIENLDEVLERKCDYSKDNVIENNLKQVKFLPENFQIKPAWQKTSFTGISKYLETKDFSASQEHIIPKGKRMGILLHNIFENLDFDASIDEIQEMVERKLGGFKEFSGQDGIERKNWIEKQIQVTLNKNLGNAGKLCDIKSDKKSVELNFFMKSEKIDLKKIKEAMKEKIYDFTLEELLAKYIKGAIDLVFLGKDGKYYILDWKSNSLNDFSQSGMEEAMQQNGYHLQYYIYAVALKRWLELTHENFDFKKQFGGAYYIFIRGVNENNLNGIYFSDGKNIVDSVEKLDKIFNGEEK
ncbi:MAG: UvrD-helicase domain-containing protein [Fibromonadaceae bacterium]|jgi:exodeoxyribonuclease V beta subunit|nr:UvrD-helicase domain-containing protein [Fibromonadaceae bacterium]